MKNFKKLLSFLTIICLLAGSVIDVSAAGAGAPHITFTNEPSDSPDLRVTKKVKPLIPGTEIPEHAKFQFVLKLDGKPASGVTYTVSDQDGEIIRKSGNRQVDFETDGNGVFLLEDGQTATFEYVGNNVPYVVTERSDYLSPKKDGDGNLVTDPRYVICRRVVRTGVNGEEEIQDIQLHPEYQYQLRAMAKDGYELLSPKGGSSGNVVPGMGTIVFENQYTPKDVNGTELKVTKTISYPKEYELPQVIKDTRFWFRLEITDSENREYTVENPVSAEVETVRLTDSDGRFYLYPGETAVFADVNADEGYRVEEILETSEEPEKVCPAGWWPTETAVKEGDRIPASPVTFNNANTSFRVRKTMEDNSEPEDLEFTFQLVDAQNNPMAGVTYYRYEILSQEMITPGDTGTDSQGWTTDADGYFRLAPGEEAVFCGMAPGTSYTVKEVGRLIEENGEIKVDPSYAEQPPQSGNVTETGLLSTLHFVNSPIDVQGSLTVTKRVENLEQEGSATEDDFHFILYKKQKEAGKEEYVRVNGAVFTIVTGDVTENYATGQDDRGWEDGEFTLKAGQTARFATLSANEEYRVEEVKLTSEYVPKSGETLELGGKNETTDDHGITRTVSRKEDGSYEYIQTGAMSQEGLAFTFTNLYKPKKVDIKIAKVSDQGEPLAGAEFMLYLNKGKEDKVLPQGEPDSFRYTTEPDGDEAAVTIPGLKPGTYWLYEEKAPSGYRLLPEPLEIQIVQTQDGLQVTIDGKTYKYTSGTEIAVDSDTLKSLTVTTDRKGGSSSGGETETLNDELKLTIPNLYFYELPNSGGIGIYWYSIGGMLLMMAASLILYRKKHRGEVLRD